jgi:ACS family glucarate transporter-like MFS transporter
MPSTPELLPASTGRASSIRWLIAAMVGCFGFVSYLQRMNISVAAELMMPDLGLTKIQMGQIFSSFLFGYAIFQIPAGRLGDVVGAKKTLAIMAVLWGCLTVCTGLVPRTAGSMLSNTFLWLVGLRFLLGACEAATFPVGSRAIRNWTPPSERAFGNAFMMAGSSSAAAFTSPLVSWLMLKVGWRATFYYTSLFAFGIAGMWYLLATNRPEKHKRVNAEELRHITGDRVRTDVSVPGLASFKELITDRNILVLALSYTCEGYVLFIFVFWLYVYLVEVRGFSMLNGGVFASLPWITALLCAPLGGMVCDRIAEARGQVAGARTVIMLGYGLSGALLFVAADVGNRAVAVASLCVSVGGLYFAEPAFWATAIHFAEENAGAATGIMNTAGIAGGILSTSLTPVIVKYFGWLPALGSGAAVALACTCAWFVIGRKSSAMRE